MNQIRPVLGCSVKPDSLIRAPRDTPLFTRWRGKTCLDHLLNAAFVLRWLWSYSDKQWVETSPAEAALCDLAPQYGRPMRKALGAARKSALPKEKS